MAAESGLVTWYRWDATLSSVWDILFGWAGADQTDALAQAAQEHDYSTWGADSGAAIPGPIIDLSPVMTFGTQAKDTVQETVDKVFGDGAGSSWTTYIIMAIVILFLVLLITGRVEHILL
ncbi:MAG: hypothetical protein JSS87_12825 [Acidobacteria bacterium]|nr:hypothetical protein [Acidobacteriota bacterium]